MTRVMVVDDHEVVREGLAALVGAEADLDVVATAGTCGRALAVLRDAAPDVIVLDLRLPDGDGITLCQRLLSELPSARCIILSAFIDDRSVIAAAEAGAAAYLVKEIKGIDIVEAIRAVGAGVTPLDPAMVRLARRRVASEGHDVLGRLSPRERTIVDLIGAGASNREIAAELHLAEKTVKNYITAVLSKLGMRRRTEVAALAARLDERDQRAR